MSIIDIFKEILETIRLVYKVDIKLKFLFRNLILIDVYTNINMIIEYQLST